MILAVDAHYTPAGSTTAGVAFDDWESALPTHTFVTAVGESLSAAKAGVARMHGSHRIPTLLKAVDQLCRQGRLEPA